METTFFLTSLSLFHCVPLYVCRLCINFQDLCARLLGMVALLILLLTFTSRFVIDFLSIRKVIIFSAIATDDRHPLRSRSIHQNAANCMTIRFRYIAQPRGVRKTYCARSRNDVRRLTSRSNGMPSKKIMESLRTFVVVETVLPPLYRGDLSITLIRAQYSEQYLLNRPSVRVNACVYSFSWCKCMCLLLYTTEINCCILVHYMNIKTSPTAHVRNVDSNSCG